MTPDGTPTPAPRINLRRPDVMERVAAEVAMHFHSPIIDQLRRIGGSLTIDQTTIHLAQEFGFCYGVERAIDLAYASRKVFPEQRIFLIGEIIHNPDVNRHLQELNITSLPWKNLSAEYDQLTPDDVVIVPAFGTTQMFMDKLKQKGCHIIDTTCGDVMKVWRRVRSYAKQNITSIIHGKASHEETRATASRALGDDQKGHFLVIYSVEDANIVCNYLKNGGKPEEFLTHFKGAHSNGFNPDTHLLEIGIANQTTMLKGETLEIQKLLHEAINHRDGNDQRFHSYDTICGATQDRQDALFTMLKKPLDMLLVVGGYNSSNTTHLVEIAQPHVPTFFIRDAARLVNINEIIHFDLLSKQEISSYSDRFHAHSPIEIGITAGASCPNNLIEETLYRIFELRGTSRQAVQTALTSQD